MIDIISASTTEHFQIIRQLFSEYADALGFSLCFQDFENELQSLPWEYAEPRGCILLASVNSRIFDGGTNNLTSVAGATDLQKHRDWSPAGCVALRPLDVNDGMKSCEMKRLYVKLNFRGKGLGQALSERLIEIAKSKGYDKMRLDTVPAMTAAIAMYRSLGFVEIEPYRANPIPGALYMEKTLVIGR